MKKTLILLTAVALVGGLLSAASVSAQEAPAPVVPEVVNIDDPLGDGNYLNDQGFAIVTGEQGDNESPESVSTVGDILKVWFTNDATNFNLHIQTQAPPPATTNAIFFRVTANPGDFEEGCIWFEATIAAPSYQGPNSAWVGDECAGEDFVEGAVAVAESEDGSGVTTLTFPLGAHPSIAENAVITAPIATSRNRFGASGVAGPTVPQIDNTKPGTDYTVTVGPVGEEPPVVDPPPVDPPVKKGCKKGKGKKKGCKPKCPAIVPAAGAEEARLTVVTDKATEAAPIEIPITAPAGTPNAIAEIFENIQVDSKAKSAGLYIRYEFADDEDMDMYALNADGSTAAQAAGFNPFPFIPNNPVFFTDGTGTGGHSEVGAEQIDGVLTPDCGGYSTQLDSFLSPGGEKVLKVWLGPATWDPVAQAPIDGGE